MEFVINNIIGRSHCNMTALRFILLTETLVCSVHETADLTCDLFRRIGIRLDGFSSDDILVGVCVFRRNAGSLNRAVERDDLEIIGGKHPEAVVHHVVADRITVVLLLLNRLTQNKVEFLDDLDNTVGFNLIPGGCTTGFEHVDLPGVADEDFASSVLAASLGKKGEMAEVFQREPEISVENLISHQRYLGGNTFLVDGVQNVNKSGASSLFHEWYLPSAFS